MKVHRRRPHSTSESGIFMVKKNVASIHGYGILISLTQDDDVDYSYSHIELNHTQRDTSTFTLISELRNPCMLMIT